ncbi:hypothetical protein FKM82_020323, partial [Ascaphus truei]
VNLFWYTAEITKLVSVSNYFRTQPCLFVYIYTHTRVSEYNVCFPRAELLITAGGENVPPVLIEDAVKRQLAIVSTAVLIGDRRKFLSMLLTLKSTVDPDTSEPTDNLTQEAIRFCQDTGSKATTVSDIVGQKDQAVYRAIQGGIDKVNREAASNAQRIQKWIILAKDFSISGGEMGPTMKLKRQAILEKYKKEVDSFYKV